MKVRLAHFPTVTKGAWTQNEKALAVLSDRGIAKVKRTNVKINL